MRQKSPVSYVYDVNELMGEFWMPISDGFVWSGIQQAVLRGFRNLRACFNSENDVNPSAFNKIGDRDN